MDKAKIDRINQLARKSRETQLTPAEKAEQQKLRAEYIAAFRGSLQKQLDNIDIVHPDGSTQALKKKK